MSRRQLTRKQHAFLQYLRQQLDAREVWPTYREIVDHFGYRSPNSVTQNLQALAKKGFLRRDDSGYHLIDKPARGELAVQGILEDGAIRELREGPRTVSIPTLFPSMAKAQVLRVGSAQTKGDLEGARFIFIGDGHFRDGDTVIVVSQNQVSLRRAYKEGATIRLESMDGSGAIEIGSRYETPSSAYVLGRYLGHSTESRLVVSASHEHAVQS